MAQAIQSVVPVPFYSLLTEVRRVMITSTTGNGASSRSNSPVKRLNQGLSLNRYTKATHLALNRELSALVKAIA